MNRYSDLERKYIRGTQPLEEERGQTVRGGRGRLHIMYKLTSYAWPCVFGTL